MTVHGFWGLKVCPGKRYTQKVTLPFMITMASLTDTITSSKRCSLLVNVDGVEFVLCSLTPEKLEQQVLNTTIMEGEEVTFSIKGDNTVHLTGNHIFDIAEGESENQHPRHTVDQQKKAVMDNDDNDDETLISDITNNQQKRKRPVTEADAKDATKRFKDENDLTSPSQYHSSTCEKEQRKLQTYMDTLNGDVEELKQQISSLSQPQHQYHQRRTSTSPTENSKTAQKDKEKSPKEYKNKKKVADNETKSNDTNKKANGDQKQLNMKKNSDDKKATTGIKKSLASLTSTSSTSTSEASTASANQNLTGKEKPSKLKVVRLPNGMVVEDKKIGSGRAAMKGNKVGMRYLGKLLNGKKFDSHTSGIPFRFALGKGSVIRGFDIGVAGMKVGGERKLIVPPSLAYKQRGVPPDIPPNSTLVFDIKLVELE